MRTIAILSILLAIISGYAIAMHISAQPTYTAPASAAPAARCKLSVETLNGACYIDARDLLDGCRIDGKDITYNCAN